MGAVAAQISVEEKRGCLLPGKTRLTFPSRFCTSLQNVAEISEARLGAPTVSTYVVKFLPIVAEDFGGMVTAPIRDVA